MCDTFDDDSTPISTVRIICPMQKADLHHQTSVTSDPRIDTKSVQVHNKSWVFEATGDEDDDANFDESSVSLCSSVSPSHSGPPNGGGGAGSHQQQPHHQMLAQPAQTAVVNAAGHQHQRQRRISRVSDAASERFAMQMTSFSRCATPSPVPRSGTQSPAHGAGLFSPYSDYLDPAAVVKPTPTASSFGVHKQHHVAADGGASSSTTTITNNRLTVDFLAAATAKLKPVTGAHPSQLPHVHDTSNATSTDPTSMTTQADDSPYASLLAELEHSLHEKMASSFSPDNTSLSTSDNKFSSKSASSSKDLEFSKELEAALQLIQELETPSEGPYLGDAQLLHHHQIAAIAGGAGGADAVPSTSQLGRSDSEKTLSAAVSLPSPEAGPLVDTSSTPTDGVSMAPTQLSASASMHRLVIDVRAATTTPTSPTAVELTIAGTPTTTATVTPAHSTNGKHVFSVFCNDRNGGGGGSQSTSGYSSPSTSSHMTAHSVRDSCEPTPGDQRVLLNSFGAANIIHIQATQHGGQQSSNRYVPGYYQSQYQQPRTPAAVASNGLTPTMFINTLNPAPNSIEHQRRSSSTSSSSSEYRNPVAMTASPASRSTSSTLAHDAGAASPASKSFLLFKKRSKLMPQPDFQSRIFKSECLAYLTESELLQRHQLNRNVIRVSRFGRVRSTSGRDSGWGYCEPNTNETAELTKFTNRLPPTYAHIHTHQHSEKDMSQNQTQ